jgi:hypothetical protein
MSQLSFSKPDDSRTTQEHLNTCEHAVSFRAVLCGAGKKPVQVGVFHMYFLSLSDVFVALQSYCQNIIAMGGILQKNVQKYSLKTLQIALIYQFSQLL